MLGDTGEFKVAPHKDGVGSASYLREDVGTEVTRGTDHVRVSHPECTPLRVFG